METEDVDIPNHSITILDREAYLLATKSAGPNLVGAYNAILSYNSVFMELLIDIKKKGDCIFHPKDTHGFRVLQSVENNLQKYCEHMRIDRSALH